MTNRIFWLKRVVVGGLIAGLLLSMKLWTGGRFFPHAPVLANFPTVPPSVETMMYVLLLGLLSAILVLPKPSILIFSALLLAAIFGFCDQMRWQPWCYQYFVMLATLGVFSWDDADTEKRQAVAILQNTDCRCQYNAIR